MAGIFGSGRVNKPQPPATSLRVTTSLQGQSRSIVYGQTRIAANLVDYAGFKATAVSSGGGKGGLVGSGGKSGSTGQYNYQASVIASFGEAISDVVAIYNSSAVDFLVSPSSATLTALSQIGITPTYGNTYAIELHTGGGTQAVSSFWNGAFPTRILAYRGEAYAVFPNLQLGTSPTFPNFNFEILGTINSDIPALGPDANPADVIRDLLTNPVYGVPGFSSTLIGDFNTAKTYWRATGLMISHAITNQTAASSILKELLKALNAEFRWSNGKLDIVPFGDVAVTGNGYSYSPNTTPIYDLTPDDFLPNQGSLVSSNGGTTAIAFSRKDPVDVPNVVRIEYVNRNALYNPAIITATDDASITQNGMRISDKRQNHFFALTSAASTSAALQLHRELATQTTWQITVGRRFSLLEPLDLITISEPALGVTRKLMRIMEIQENSDYSRTFTMEEVPLTAHAPAYGRQADLGTGRNSNLPAPSVNAPYFFEPPDQLGKGLKLLIGLSGSDPANWGGCQIWISSDQTSYTLLGEVSGATRMGVTNASLPAVTPAYSGATIDATNPLQVDLSESASSLGNGSAQDLAAFNTALVVGSEVIAYQNATLTGAHLYSLSPLSRGGYGSTIASQPIGSQVMRLDGEAFEWEFTSDRIGSTVYFKFVSFNPFGAGWQSLSDVGPYAYTISGAALASSLPNVANVRTVFEAGVTKVWWDEVNDFRPLLYEFRKGSAWGSAITIGRQAHPPFVAFGDDTYWVSAVTNPAAGITAYSGSPSSIAIQGALLTQNIVRSYDEQASGWTGALSNGLKLQGVGAGGYLSGDGTYEIPTSHIIDVGYVAQCLVGVSYTGTGQPVGQNILSVADVLSYQDILGFASAQYVDVSVEIATATTTSPTEDVFSPNDAFGLKDVFALPVWSDWRKFVPGVYVARFIKFRVTLLSKNASVTAACTALNYSVSVPARIDHYQNLAIPAAGLTIQFTPDGSTVPAPFTGGPDNQSLPYLSATWPNQAGDTLSFSVTNSTAFVQILNGGAGVARSNVNITVEGY